MVALCCAIVAVLLYLHAEAKATGFHDFYRHFIHPWESTSATLLTLVVCVVSIVVAGPAFRYGSMFQRVGMGFILLLPAFIIAGFLFWIVHQWSAK